MISKRSTRVLIFVFVISVSSRPREHHTRHIRCPRPRHRPSTRHYKLTHRLLRHITFSSNSVDPSMQGKKKIFFCFARRFFSPNYYSSLKLVHSRVQSCRSLVHSFTRSLCLYAITFRYFYIDISRGQSIPYTIIASQAIFTQIFKPRLISDFVILISKDESCKA